MAVTQTLCSLGIINITPATVNLRTVKTITHTRRQGRSLFTPHGRCGHEQLPVLNA
jgi:hypothetical protein